MRWFLLLLLCLPVVPAVAREKWDVDKPPGPVTSASIDVREGTWISLDVSKDTIVFDLLGDLYLLPLSGGEARALTSGMAWDMQPRFSPDGRKVAFTSDRGGGDNVWTVGVDGTGFAAVSKEEFRLLNSPCWSPDGQYLAARKHFTGTRSLGAGEIWLYHVTGGDGLQVTAKTNDQKDLGEPAFSPDGRYVYYSQDSTAGKVFEYNKDANDEIYTISRVDRQTGEVEKIAGGAGGACRPVPHPDGKRIAYVKRIRGESVLMLRELQSGRETRLYAPLDRDMQETWAIHGVYPAMAWTPDGQSLVFWAGGGLKRLYLGSLKVDEIPFHVSTSRTLSTAVRFPHEVAPPTFPLKMLRWTQLSPRGDQVVFQALGYLWARPLAGGAPRRLTSQKSSFEFYPSWSRDGQSIVYTSWNDRNLGRVLVVSASGGEGKVVSGEPGHYHEPCLSPDGAHVVYRKGTGGYLTSPLWSRKPGLYCQALSGGAPRFLGSGSEPHFGASSDRVFFTRGNTLCSVDLQGHEFREHVSTERGGQFRVSPDSSRLAWVEGYQAYETPFAQTGKKYDLNPRSTALPVKRVSKLCGQYLHWADGTLHWAWGPVLYSSKGQHELGFTATQDVPDSVLALENARIVTMRGDEVIERGTLVVTGNRITAVGAGVSVPAGARRVDCAGKTIIPGLVDVHWHGSMTSDGITPQQSWVNLASLAFGITTLHDPSNDTAEVFSAAELARTGAILAPRIFSTGTIIYGAKADVFAPIDSLEDARDHLGRLKQAGAISVKSYNQPRRDQRQQVIAAARELLMMVVPEGGSLLQHNLTFVVDGHTGVEHTVPVGKVYQDVLQLWGQSAVGYTPTLGVAYGGVWGENYWYDKTDVWAHPILSRFVPREILDPRSRRRVKAPDEEYNHFAQARVASALSSAGVGVNLGAHGQREGLAAHWELWMFVQGGMTPLQALRCGTLNGARYIGLDKDVGSLEVGKLADAVVISGNPLEDIRLSDKVAYTLLNGRLYESSSMNEVAPSRQARAPFWFEGSAGPAAAPVGDGD